MEAIGSHVKPACLWILVTCASAYVIHRMFDNSHLKGGACLPSFQRSRIWYYFKKYFSASITCEKPLDPNKQYIFCNFPHGACKTVVLSLYLRHSHQRCLHCNVEVRLSWPCSNHDWLLWNALRDSSFPCRSARSCRLCSLSNPISSRGVLTLNIFVLSAWWRCQCSLCRTCAVCYGSRMCGRRCSDCSLQSEERPIHPDLRRRRERAAHDQREWAQSVSTEPQGIREARAAVWCASRSHGKLHSSPSPPHPNHFLVWS